MVTVHREAGLSFVIFANDHPPAHIHAFGAGEAKIDLAAPGGPSLVWVDGMKRGDVRRMMRIVSEKHDFLLQAWEKIHG
jgi:hypothetical protein